MLGSIIHKCLQSASAPCTTGGATRVAPLLALLLLLSTGAMSRGAEEIYYVNGQQVGAQKYEAYRLTQSAIDSMKEDRITAAVSDLRRALKVDPTLSEAHTMLAVALARMGHTDQAEEQFQMAIVSNPDSAAARLDLASLYQTSGKLADAVRLYKSFLQDNPDAKQSEAIEDRIKLLEAEINRQSHAIDDPDEKAKAEASYLANVTDDGARHWPDLSMPIKVYIAPGDGLKNYRPEFERILEQSFREWERAAHGKIHLRFCGSPEDADIFCEWVDDPAKLASSAEGGETQVRYIGNSICKAKMLLSVVDTNSLFPLTNNLVRLLCLHEVGHSLGLIGHSANPKDIMFCTAPIIDREQHLTTRDIATLNQLYDTPLDQWSLMLAYLEHETHGNAINVIRIALILLTAVIASAIGLSAVASASKKTKKKKKAATTAASS